KRRSARQLQEAARRDRAREPQLVEDGQLLLGEARGDGPAPQEGREGRRAVRTHYVEAHGLAVQVARIGEAGEAPLRGLQRIRVRAKRGGGREAEEAVHVSAVLDEVGEEAEGTLLRIRRALDAIGRIAVHGDRPLPSDLHPLLRSEGAPGRLGRGLLRKRELKSSPAVGLADL